MLDALKFLKNFVHEESGQDFVEYVLLVGGISVLLISGSGALVTAMSGAYGTIASYF